MACAMVLDPRQDFQAWLSTQGVSSRVAQVVERELGIGDYEALLACAESAQVRSELFLLARERLPFATYAVLRRAIESLASRRQDGGEASRGVDALGLQPFLSGLLDSMVVLLTTVSQELSLSAQRLSSLEPVIYGETPVEAGGSTQGYAVSELDAAERLDTSGSDSKELQVEVQNGSSQSWATGYVKAEAFSKDVPGDAENKEVRGEGHLPVEGLDSEHKGATSWMPVKMEQSLERCSVDVPDMPEEALPLDQVDGSRGCDPIDGYWTATVEDIGVCSEVGLGTLAVNRPEAAEVTWCFTMPGQTRPSQRDANWNNGSELHSAARNMQGSAPWGSGTGGARCEGSVDGGGMLAGRPQPHARSRTRIRHRQTVASGMDPAAAIEFKNPVDGRNVYTNEPREDSHSGCKSRPFQCRVCGNSFSKRYGLNVHLRTHTGERPYSCRHCGRKFSVSHNLARHMKMHSVTIGLPGCQGAM
uniref:zinc finger protein with KRAB and SCAN domains 1-like isoform X2 n=1 Tax=Myxine glutinosa TaxID=7769 RepID=UPI00358F42F0